MTESSKTIGEIVADDYRTAKVFEEHGIDFCCGGKIELRRTCLEKGIDLASMTAELEAVKQDPLDQSHNYSSWDLSFLTDYIVNVHHTYINENIGKIAELAHKIADIHGLRHPELVEIASIFDRIVTDMEAHLREEEDEFFPALKRVEQQNNAGAAPAEKDLENIRNSLRTLIHEHEEVGDAIHKIHHLSNGFVIPDDACNTFLVTYRKLQEFEDDLHKHVHLENNILFTKAEQL